MKHMKAEVAEQFAEDIDQVQDLLATVRSRYQEAMTSHWTGGDNKTGTTEVLPERIEKVKRLLAQASDMLRDASHEVTMYRILESIMEEA